MGDRLGWARLRAPATRRLAATVLTVAALAAVAGGAAWWGGALQRLEAITFDARARVARAKLPGPSRVAVVLVDETSLAALAPLVGRWPWPRSVLADVLDFLALGGAQAVVSDILFTEPQQGGGRPGDAPGRDDQRLVAATRQGGKVVHAARIFREQPDPGAPPREPRPLPADFARRHTFPVRPLASAAGACDAFALPLPDLVDASRAIGAVDLTPDTDGVFRRLALFQEIQGRRVPTLGLAGLLAAFDAPVGSADPFALLPGGAPPTDPSGAYLLNPYGHFDTYSVSGILASVRQLAQGEVANLLVSPYDFENRIVFLGASAAGLEDLKATSLSTATPGVLLHATLAANLLTADHLRAAPLWAGIAALLVLPLVAAAAVLIGHRILPQVLLPVAVGGAYGVACVALFQARWVLPVAPPLLALVLSWGGSYAVRAATEGRSQRRVRKMLSQYVSPTVLQEVTDHYQEVLQAEVGQNRTLTVLFSDIRGFTGLSENASPRAVVEMLNLYFTHMTEAVFATGGTIDKFIGDAIMCFWGAPIVTSDHAQRAVCCALEMQHRLGEVNRLLAQRQWAPIGIGVGVNSGEVVLGNIGSDRKLDYTVIGDDVNLASRIEGLTRRYGCAVLLSESTRAGLDESLPCGVVDQVRVKGKRHPVRLYQPLVTAGADAAAVRQGHELAAAYSRAFERYLEGDWEGAAAEYRALPADGVRAEFLRRCAEYRAAGVAADWDGVCAYTSK